MPIVATQFSFSLKSTTPANVGSTTESLLDSEVTVTPERWVEAVISTYVKMNQKPVMSERPNHGSATNCAGVSNCLHIRKPVQVAKT